MQIGRKVYYELNTGNVIFVTESRNGSAVETTIDQDFENYIELSSRVQSSVGIIQLNYGQLGNEFSTCFGYHVDITKNPIDANAIIFSYTPPDAPLDAVKLAKLAELKQECYNIIIAGFNSTAKYGVIHKYTLSDLDQANMLTLIRNIDSGMSTVVPWHYEGQVVCEAWSADDFKTLYQQATVFGLNYRTKSDIIEKYIDEQTLTVDEINAITMGFVLPTDYETQFESKLAEFNCPVWVAPTA